MIKCSQILGFALASQIELFNTQVHPKKKVRCMFNRLRWEVHFTIETQWKHQVTHLKSYPLCGCNTSGAILWRNTLIKTYWQLNSIRKIKHLMLKVKNKRLPISHQHGVPTKVFLDLCLSTLSNMQADTPKSASLTAPLASSSIFPACNGKQWTDWSQHTCTAMGQKTKKRYCPHFKH